MPSDPPTRRSWCLACAAAITGDVCLECGASQSILVKQRSLALQSLRQDAENALAEQDFSRAQQLAKQLLGETCEALSHYSEWAKVFLAESKHLQTHVYQEATASLAAAVSHEQSHRYSEAIACVESIPVALRGTVGLRGQTALLVHQRLVGKKGCVDQLRDLVSKRLRFRKYDGLLPYLEKLCVYYPDDSALNDELVKLRVLAVERKSEVDAIYAQAHTSLRAGDFEKTLAILSILRDGHDCAKCVRLKEEATFKIKMRDKLRSEIFDRKQRDAGISLIDAVEEYLRLCPGDERALSLKSKLVSRAKTDSAANERACSVAAVLERKCQFRHAVRVLEGVAHDRRSLQLKEYLAKLSGLAFEQSRASRAIDEWQAKGFGERQALDCWRSYEERLRVHGLVDGHVKEKAVAVAAEVTRKQCLLWLGRVCKVFVVLGVFFFGVFEAVQVYRRYRDVRLSEVALADKRWEDAIELNPSSALPYLGRALAEVRKDTPDFRVALQDVATAELLGGGNSSLFQVKAEVHAWQAICCSESGDLVQASKALVQAEELCGTIHAVQLARVTLNNCFKELFYADAFSRSYGDVVQTRELWLQHGVPVDLISAVDAVAKLCGSVEAFRKGRVAHAFDLMHDAVLLDPEAAGAIAVALPSDFVAFVRERCRSRFDQSVAAGEWETAGEWAASFECLLPGSDGWLRDAIGECSAEAAKVVPTRLYSGLPIYINSVGMGFKLVPGGRVAGVSDNGEAFDRCISRPFFVSVWETRNSDWQRVMNTFDGRILDRETVRGDGDRPKTGVSWFEAVAFCEKLNGFSWEGGRERMYRLPTETEWELACRAGTRTTYSCGDSDAVLESFAWFGGREKQCQPVGTKNANAWGLYDMHGNVLEWCSDWFDGLSGGDQVDPQGAISGTRKVCRGGGWKSTGASCGSSVRGRNAPSHRSGDVGFRVVFSLPDKSPNGGVSSESR